MTIMRFGSLFSGVGGFDLAFERAGMTCAWQCEIDAAARNVLRQRFSVPIIGDVRDVTRDTVSPVDVICGGFPCQDVSVAGKRAGLAGERSGLWFEFHRVVADLKPQWVVVENVPGLLSSNGGRDFAAIVRGLVECGYGVAWRILDAQYFGVPQRRRRVFIVGSLGDGRAAEVLFESEGVSGDSAQGRATWPAIATALVRGAHPGGITGREIESGVYAFSSKDDGADVCENISPTLRSMNYDQSHVNGGGQVAVYAPVAHHGGLDAETSYVFESRIARNGRGTPEAVAPPLKAQSGGTGKGDGAPLIAIRTAQTGSNGWGIDDSGTSYTIDQTGAGAIMNGGIRRLTPTECERLQGFPDGWTAGQSDSARYRQLGNAVAVPVVEWIGWRIVQAESAP